MILPEKPIPDYSSPGMEYAVRRTMSWLAMIAVVVSVLTTPCAIRAALPYPAARIVMDNIMRYTHTAVFSLTIPPGLSLCLSIMAAIRIRKSRRLSGMPLALMAVAISGFSFVFYLSIALMFLGFRLD